MKSEEGDVVERRRIAACCWGEGRPATCLVMLDDQGSLADILYLPSFSDQQRVIRAGLDYSIAEDPRKVKSKPRLLVPVTEAGRQSRPVTLNVFLFPCITIPLMIDFQSHGFYLLAFAVAIYILGSERCKF